MTQRATSSAPAHPTRTLNLNPFPRLAALLARARPAPADPRAELRHAIADEQARRRELGLVPLEVELAADFPRSPVPSVKE